METGPKCRLCGRQNEPGRSTCSECGAPLPETGAAGAPGAPAAGGSAGRSAAERLRRGQVVANRYIVHSVIGRGGMGRIYKVHDNTLDEVVALKVLLPEHVQDQEVVGRFFNEARIARGLSHPNIGRVHDIGVADQNVYISMEYIEGKSLRELMEDLPAGERLAMKTVLAVFRELCDALSYAHQVTVHRDLKPENIMLDLDGRTKLMDFGISKLMANPSHTSASLVLGTPQYMSPEQLRSSADVDARSDIYSLGIMLYEILTGNTPTGLAQPATGEKDAIPPVLDAIIEKCLQPAPRDRFANMNELGDALREIEDSLEGEAVLAGKVSPSRSKRSASEKARKAVAVGLLVLIGASGAGGLWKAEEQRQALISPLELRITEPTAPGGSTQAAIDSADTFKALSHVLGMAAIAAENAARDVDPDRRPWVTAILKKARESRAGAEDEIEQFPRMAISSGWDAMRGYLAIIMDASGKMFVPQGDVTLISASGEEADLRIDAFFIDERPVLAAAFQQFCQGDDPWRWPNFRAASPADPMGGVTYYDAQAYTASQFPGEKVPTAAQWSRAAQVAGQSRKLYYLNQEPRPVDQDSEGEDGTVPDGQVQPLAESYGSFYIPLNGREWSRSMIDDFPFSESAASRQRRLPNFGSDMAVVSGAVAVNGEYLAGPLAAMAYEGSLAGLGFRGVSELPSTLDGVRAFLGQEAALESPQ